MLTDRAALVEKVARLMCEQRGQHPNSVCYRLKIDGGHETIRRWMNYTTSATAAIDLIRAEALEEAGKRMVERRDAEVERLTGERDRQYDYNVGQIAENQRLRATNERLVKALEMISSAWETPPMEYMTSSRALAKFMWKTAATALAEEKPNAD